MKTWTVIYNVDLDTLSHMINPSGMTRAAVVVAEDRSHAIAAFQDQYAGQFSVIQEVKEN